jgi:hypothetical protein
MHLCRDESLAACVFSWWGTSCAHDILFCSSKLPTERKGGPIFLLPFALAPHPPLRVPGSPPAPLSPSSGGLADRSDWERGSRPPCTAGSLGFFSWYGALPLWSFEPASSGDVGRWRVLSPLRRPWRTAARARSGRSSSNKLGLGGLSWPLAWGPEIPL